MIFCNLISDIIWCIVHGQFVCMATYLVFRRTKHWYKQLSIYLVQLAASNAPILFSAAWRKQSFLKFQESIIRCHKPKPWCSEQATWMASSQCRSRYPRSPIPLKRCVYSRHGIRRDTRLWCPDCQATPGLRIGGCFQSYHTLVTY